MLVSIFLGSSISGDDCEKWNHNHEITYKIVCNVISYNKSALFIKLMGTPYQSIWEMSWISTFHIMQVFSHILLGSHSVDVCSMILDKVPSVIDLFLKYLRKLTDLYVDVINFEKSTFSENVIRFQRKSKELQETLWNVDFWKSLITKQMCKFFQLFPTVWARVETVNWNPHELSIFIKIHVDKKKIYTF